MSPIRRAARRNDGSARLTRRHSWIDSFTARVAQDRLSPSSTTIRLSRSSTEDYRLQTAGPAPRGVR